MQCVILAAGEGLRMRPLTLETPKPLLKVNGKPILERIIEVLPSEIDELVLVVGYRGAHIRSFCGSRFLGRPVTYVEQEKKLGTANALELCRPHLAGERFLVLNADDLHSRESLAECVRYEKALVVAEHPNPERFGVVTLNADGTVSEVIEKPEHPASNIVSTGAMVTDHAIFNYKADLHPNGEYYLANAFNKMLKDGHRVVAVRTAGWFPIGTPEDLAAAEKLFR
jgi:NDP-sugar pyrophosphorylase family protein